MSDISTILKEAVADTINQFQRNPFDFLYESDLEGLLYSILRAKCDEKNLRTTFNNGGTSINPVKTHYRYPSIIAHRQHIDIVVLETDKLDDHMVEKYAQQLYGTANKVHIPWHFPVRCAVEVKYLKVGDPILGKKGKVNNWWSDLKKLWELKKCADKMETKPFLGLGILFVQTEELWDWDKLNKDIQMTKCPDLPDAESGVFGIVVPPVQESGHTCWYFENDGLERNS